MGGEPDLVIVLTFGMRHESRGLVMAEFDASRIHSIPLPNVSLPNGLSGAMWAVNVPAKVKITMWRVSKNFFPTFQNLQRRRLPVSNVCAICKSYGESVEHLMHDCNFVQQLLERLGLPVASNLVADPWINWIASYFVSLSGREQRVLIVLYSAVWFARNKLVHEGMLNSVDDVVAFVVAFLQEQDTLNEVLPAPTQVRVASWQAPLSQ
ncbi:hypothetical protein V6N13_075180 [Hibiscus sabdariffa]